MPYYLAPLWDAGLKRQSNERKTAAVAQKAATKTVANKPTTPGVVPKELREKLKRSRGAKGLLMDLEGEVRKFVADWEDIFEMNAPVGDLVARLKTLGYTLLLGSNTYGLHAPFYRKKFRATLDHFDHFVFSHEAKSLKPDRGFFDACVKAAGVPAGSCVFIDDLAANVEGARAALDLAIGRCSNDV